MVTVEVKMLYRGVSSTVSIIFYIQNLDHVIALVSYTFTNLHSYSYTLKVCF